MGEYRQYSDKVVFGMQMLYGEGYLSPGGADELGLLMQIADPAGLRVLDVVSGLGGTSIALVRDYGAAHVTGIDIEPELIERSKKAVGDAGLEDRIDIREVEPGPLPLDDRNYDLIITKDVICHMPDKTSVFREFNRVLKPGGSYLCADFYDASHDADTSEEGRALYNDYIDAMLSYGLSFFFESLSVYQQALVDAGLPPVAYHDHTEASASHAGNEKDIMSGPDAGVLKEALGEGKFSARQSASTIRQKALSSRGLLHGHIQAQKPD